jgi:hypothetical protein
LLYLYRSALAFAIIIRFEAHSRHIGEFFHREEGFGEFGDNEEKSHSNLGSSLLYNQNHIARAIYHWEKPILFLKISNSLRGLKADLLTFVLKYDDV